MTANPMLLFFLSLVLALGSAFDYRPSEEPLNGSQVRGFRPIESEEIVVDKLKDEWIIVFTGWNNRQTAIYARTRSPESDDWSEPLRISSEEARFDSLPHIWVSPDWVVHCVWQSKQPSKQFSVLHASRDPVSGKWTHPAGIEGAGGIMRSPVSVTGDSKGNPFVWSHNRPVWKLLPELQLYASRNAGKTWDRLDPFSSLRTPEVSFFDPRLLVTQGGELHLLTLRSQAVTTVFLTSSRDAGRSWTSPVALNETPSPRISDPRLWLSQSLLQATWVDQPEPARSTKRLEAAFLATDGEAEGIHRLLLQEVKGTRSLEYRLWEDDRRAGVIWLHRPKRGRSAVRRMVTVVEGRINPGEPSTVAQSREGFHFEEFATSHRPDLVLMTEKKIITPPTLQACSRTEMNSWECEKIHTTSGASDILAPMLIAEGSENVYRVIFHEVRLKMHLYETVLDTTISTGRLSLRSGEGENGDGGTQGNASSARFK